MFIYDFIRIQSCVYIGVFTGVFTGDVERTHTYIHSHTLPRTNTSLNALALRFTPVTQKKTPSKKVNLVQTCPMQSTRMQKTFFLRL